MTHTADTQTFSVVFRLPGAESLEGHLDSFARTGCDDAAFMGPATDGTFTAEFDREAATFPEAVVGAIEDLAAAAPELVPLRVLPDDLVTMAAIAERAGRSKESVRLLKEGRRGPGGFPPAVGHIDNKTQVWRWADVSRWFADALGEPLPGGQHARFIAALNHALELTAMTSDLVEHPEEAEAVAQFMPRELQTA